MLKIHKLILILMMAFFIFLTASCARKMARNDEALVTAPPEASEPVDNSNDEDALDAQLQEERLLAEAAALEAAKAAFVEENVHFAHDSSALSDQARMILNKKADFLRSNPGPRITVEGHCDERGSAAYNMALGQQRAESVKIFLINQGVDAARLNVASFGENKPIATGQDEESLARNRRAEFVIN
jgi:peptidoglycan-associated lipoprotein